MWYDSFIHDTTHSYVLSLIQMWRDSFRCDVTHSYVTCLIHTWDMNDSYVPCLIHMWHDAFIYDMWRLICDMTPSYVTRLIHMWHDSFIRDTTHSYVPCLLICDLFVFGVFMCAITQADVTWIQAYLPWAHLCYFMSHVHHRVWTRNLSTVKTMKKNLISLSGHFSILSKLSCHIEYGVATMSRLLKIVGLFCKRAL